MKRTVYTHYLQKSMHYQDETFHPAIAKQRHLYEDKHIM